jgi:outer membrane protein insertion porin family
MRAAALALALVLGCALAARAAAEVGDVGPPPRVAAVELRLPPGEPREAVAALVAIAPGDARSARALRLTVQRLYLTGRYRTVVVREAPAPPPPGGAGRWVRLTVEALPVQRV